MLWTNYVGSLDHFLSEKFAFFSTQFLEAKFVHLIDLSHAVVDNSIAFLFHKLISEATQALT